MDRILLLMTSATYRASAFLEAAERLGLEVTVVSDRAQALAASNPSGHLTMDFLSPEAGGAAIVDFARALPISAIVAADDEGVTVAALAAAALGLRHNPPDAVAAARNKHATRVVLAAAGLNTPRFTLTPIDGGPAESHTFVPFPCVVKPLFLSASRGVMRANDPRELTAALARLASILGTPEVAAQGGPLALRALVEAFIPGAEVALEGLLTGGVLRVLALFDKPDPLDGPFFEETIYVTPSRQPPLVQEEIARAVQGATKALGLIEGPVHAELRINDRGAWILEVAPRSIGGLCSRTLRFDGGVSLETLILLHALGRDVSHLERERAAAGVMMIPIPRAGILHEVTGIDAARSVPAIEEIRLMIPPGQEVVPAPEGSRYLGFIFARDEAPASVERALRAAHAQLGFRIAPRNLEAR